jgi:HAMP domain-containing protein
MLESGISNIMMFFVITGIAILFAILWVIKSESRIKIARDQLKALKTRLDAGERERYMLSEKLAAMEESPQPQAAESVTPKEEAHPKDKTATKKRLEEALKEKEELEEENRRLKDELSEAKASLAEVYKALCEK